MNDLVSTRQQLRRGDIQRTQVWQQCLDAARSPACANAYVLPRFEQAQAEGADPALADKPLAGLAISVKDLFDVAGQTTRAGSLVLNQAPPASADARALARLKAAGAVVMGRTHMVEFAFSGVGTNPHYPTPANTADSTLARIPGGSSSGAAVSVGCGSAFIGLGSDTGGSIRIPAALNGVVGFKSTARLVPTQGALPLSHTLDTVCAITRSVPDAILAHELLAARRVTRSPAPLAAYRLALPQTLMLDQLDAGVARAFERCLALLRAAGAQIHEIALPELTLASQLTLGGGFSAMESYAWHQTLLAQAAADYDPRVRLRIERGAGASANDYIRLQQARQIWIAQMEAALLGYDAVLSPTVPLVAPPISTVAPGGERDEAFFAVNALLLRNTSVVNLLDGCAISIPCQAAGELPVGLMVWAGALRDDTVLNIAHQAQAVLAARQQP